MNFKRIFRISRFRALFSPQDAIAYAFEEQLKTLGRPDSYFSTQLRKVKDKRDFIVGVLKNVGMVPIVPDGGYCVIANWTTLEGSPLRSRAEGAGLRFVKWLIKYIGVLGFPVTSFYGDEYQHLGEDYIRLCFYKVFSIQIIYCRSTLYTYNLHKLLIIINF